VAFVAWMTLLVATAMIVLVLLNLRTRQLGGHDLSRMWVPSVFFVIAGVGLLFSKKWAAIMLAVPLAALGTWLVVRSLIDLPLQWAASNVLIGLVMITPAIVLYRKRSFLSR
jgi:hypothetical protein